MEQTMRETMDRTARLQELYLEGPIGELEEDAAFLAWEAASRDTIDVKRVYIDLAGDLVTGILLSQLVYWWLPNGRGERKLTVHRAECEGGPPRWWIAKERDEWWDECRISPKQFDRSSEVLVERGLLVKKVFQHNGKSVVHLSLNVSTVRQRVKALLPKGEKPDSPKVKSRIPQTVNPHARDLASISETTTETNTERGRAGREEIRVQAPPESRPTDRPELPGDLHNRAVELVNSHAEWLDPLLGYGARTELFDCVEFHLRMGIRFTRADFEAGIADARDYGRLTQKSLAVGLTRVLEARRGSGAGAPARQPQTLAERRDAIVAAVLAGRSGAAA